MTNYGHFKTLLDQLVLLYSLTLSLNTNYSRLLALCMLGCTQPSSTLSQCLCLLNASTSSMAFLHWIFWDASSYVVGSSNVAYIYIQNLVFFVWLTVVFYHILHFAMDCVLNCFSSLSFSSSPSVGSCYTRLISSLDPSSKDLSSLGVFSESSAFHDNASLIV